MIKLLTLIMLIDFMGSTNVLAYVDLSKSSSNSAPLASINVEHDQHGKLNLDLPLSSELTDDTSILLGDTGVKPFNSFVSQAKPDSTLTDFSFKMPGTDTLSDECLTSGCRLKQMMESSNHTLSAQDFMLNPPEVRWVITY